VYPRVLQCVPVYPSLSQFVPVCPSLSQYASVCFSMLQNASVCFSVLQYPPVFPSEPRRASVCWVNGGRFEGCRCLPQPWRVPPEAVLAVVARHTADALHELRMSVYLVLGVACTKLISQRQIAESCAFVMKSVQDWTLNGSRVGSPLSSFPECVVDTIESEVVGDVPVFL